MATRSPAQYDWNKCLFHDRRLSKHFTRPRRGKIKHVDIHHMTVLGKGDGGANEACYRIWQNRQASGHYGIDGEHVWQFVSDNDAAWGNGNATANHEGIVVEHANSATGGQWPIGEVTFRNGARLVAALHRLYGLGRPWSNSNGSAGTVRAHRTFTNTSCPGPWFMDNWTRYVTLCQAFYDGIAGAATPTPTPIEIEDTDMPITFHWLTKKTIFTAGPQFIKAETDFYHAQVARNIGKGPENTKSGFIDAGDKEITAICESLGIPWYAVEAVMKGEAFLIDGRIASEVEGQKGRGFFWSREIEVQQTLRQLQAVDTAAVASVLATAADKAFAELGENMVDKITGDFSGKIVFEKDNEPAPTT